MRTASINKPSQYSRGFKWYSTVSEYIELNVLLKYTKSKSNAYYPEKYIICRESCNLIIYFTTTSVLGMVLVSRSCGMGGLVLNMFV